MKILFITDIHQNINALKKLDFTLYDQILCGGDIIDPHSPNLDIALRIIEILPNNTYIIPGNCDKNRKIISFMKKKLNYIHKKSVFLNKIPLTGIGYCRPMLEDIKIYRKYFMEDSQRIRNFLQQSKFHILLKFCGILYDENNITFLSEKETIESSKDFLKKFEAFSEEEILKFLKKQKNITKGIILSHSPPRGGLDKMPGLPPIGSISVRKAIDLLAPRLLLCGHFHELPGKQILNNTIIFNPGALKDNFYGEIIISAEKVNTFQKKI